MKIFLLSILTYSGFVYAQVSDKANYVIQSPQAHCCDNAGQAEGFYAETPSSVHDYQTCSTDIQTTIRGCVDRTRDGLLCPASAGARYCCENQEYNSYPRYYALYHPILLSSSSLTFTKQYNGSNPNSQTFTITNGVWSAFGGVDPILNWSATKAQNWLAVSPASGTVSYGTPTTITVSINGTSLAIGTYTDVITVSASQVSNRQWEQVAVTLNVVNSLSASISGPAVLASNQAGTYTCTASYGVPPYRYQWYQMEMGSGGAIVSLAVTPNRPPIGTWMAVGTNSPTIARSDVWDFEMKCVVTDAANNNVTSNILYVSVGSLAKIAAGNVSQSAPTAEESPPTYLLDQNYPNPFNPTTEIKYQLSFDGIVKFSVFDVLGREVAMLVDETKTVGSYSATFNASRLPSGMYFARISVIPLKEGKTFVQTMKMLLAK
jgi:hypothetical protein